MGTTIGNKNHSPLLRTQCEQEKVLRFIWEEIADAANSDEFLTNLKTAIKANNIKELENLLKEQTKFKTQTVQMD